MDKGVDLTAGCVYVCTEVFCFRILHNRAHHCVHSKRSVRCLPEIFVIWRLYSSVSPRSQFLLSSFLRLYTQKRNLSSSLMSSFSRDSIHYENYYLWDRIPWRSSCTTIGFTDVCCPVYMNREMILYSLKCKLEVMNILSKVFLSLFLYFLITHLQLVPNYICRFF